MRKTKLTSGLALAFLLSPVLATAAERPALVGFQALEGQCLEVVAGKDDLTAGCGSKVGIMRYADGRTGFYFLLAKDRMLTFSGFARGGAGAPMRSTGSSTTTEPPRPLPWLHPRAAPAAMATSPKDP